MAQTAIEWLVEQVNSDCLNSTFIQEDIIKRAKAMEEKQIRKSYTKGYNESSLGRFSDSEKYYNETFKSE